jgi:hypothetical protein
MTRIAGPPSAGMGPAADEAAGIVWLKWQGGLA